jgi:hypothetical protein
LVSAILRIYVRDWSEYCQIHVPPPDGFHKCWGLEEYVTIGSKILIKYSNEGYLRKYLCGSMSANQVAVFVFERVSNSLQMNSPQKIVSTDVGYWIKFYYPRPKILNAGLPVE